MVLVDYIWIFLTFSRWLYFVWSSFLVAIKDRSFDLFIQDDKKILFILEFRSITQPSFVFNLLEQENERNPDPSCSSAWCTCTYCREMPEGEKVCCKENSERCHSRMPVNIIFSICLYYSVAWFYFWQFCGYTSIDFAITM